ncbi:hypothetical protein NUU61_007738 [Penicillium alfredii]|uniref:Aminoglycoside phosphotransferase domain-containing protein n=1 Tax=Penicillium alfredii TaxID=1506179 RepID=A0A9W9JYV1_9EURO|nr:uncharacterized protein NUU61_007738 [Penicillium alfredii]KAJ5086431.1 hypothetical protein NUU61_007738 [Penicillium alfredii]
MQCMRFDNLAWEKSEEITDTWVLRFLEPDIWRPIGNFVIKHHNPDDAIELDIFKKGFYNISLQMKYKVGSAIIRFPQRGATMFPEEKVRNEMAIMRTQFFYSYGICSAPHTKMYDALNIPGCPPKERGIIDPNIGENKLEMLYGHLADILLQLSKPFFPQIGSLRQIDDFTWDVAIGLYSADDCRRKFIARRLFCKLAREHKLTNLALNNGPFKIWCDDPRPANVLLDDDLHIVSVVDWDFTYAAPVEFSYPPPWWLFIGKPESWLNGLEDRTSLFGRQLQTFLKAMVGRENTAIKQGRLTQDQRLSDAMRHSWESGDFWVAYAARNSFAFDAIYWRQVDARLFGPTASSPEDVWRPRVDLLGDKEKEMERLVARKLEEMKAEFWHGAPMSIHDLY